MVDIYGIKILRQMDQDTFDNLLNLVAPEKRERINRFAFFEDAQRCLLGDLLARYAICNRFNIKSSQLKFGRNEYGKPILTEHKDIHFNLSHAGDWVVCAADNAPVGIDVEVIQPINFDIAKRFFTKAEYNDLMGQDEKNRLHYFYTLWTLKESYIKAVGKGLSIPLNCFSFTIEKENIRLTTKNESVHCSFRKHQIDEKHIVSLCTTHHK